MAKKNEKPPGKPTPVSNELRNGAFARSSSTPPEYRIRVFADVLKIPADRIPVFLAELPACLESMRGMLKLGFETEEFVWVDEGAPHTGTTIESSPSPSPTDEPLA